jgi:Alkaline phosphatase PhoX
LAESGTWSKDSANANGLVQPQRVRDRRDAAALQLIAGVVAIPAAVPLLLLGTVAIGWRRRSVVVGIIDDGRTFPFAFNRLNDEEFAGVTFSPDGHTLFVNIQGPPGLTFATWDPGHQGSDVARCVA